MIPEGWREVCIGDIASISGGTTPSKEEPLFWNGRILWATPSDITSQSDSNLYLSDTEEKITEFALSNSGVKLLPADSVLMTSRATIGEVVINTKPTATNQGFCNFIPSDQITNKYLLYWLKNAKAILRNISSGSTFLEINKTSLKKINILLPPLPEQQQIAEVLGSVDASIEATKAVIEQTKKLKSGLLQTLLTRGIGHTRFKPSPLGEIPESWEVVELGKIAQFSQGVQIDLSKQVQLGQKNFVKFIRIENYTQNSRDFRYIPIELAKDKFVNYQDVVVVRYGASAGFVGTGLSGVLANNLFKITPDNAVIINKYLYLNLKSDSTYDFFQSVMFGNAMPALNFGVVGRLKITLPPLQEQHAIADIFEGIDAQITAETFKLTALQTLKKGLMHDLLTGKVRVI